MNKKGFTLIELLVVIAIIGILATIGLVALNGAREKARDATRKSDIAQYNTALVLYSDDNGNAYPPSLVAANSCVTGSGTGCNPTLGSIFDKLATGNPIFSGYISKAPGDPTGSATLRYVYQTCIVSTASHYVLYAQLESPANSYFWTKQDGTSGDKDMAVPACT